MSPDAPRPTPEHFLSLIRQQQRGRLKIYLGFAAGVGKTYEMLQEGHRLRAQNVNVVIGVVETHGRAETMALVRDLEQMPRRQIEYRGVVLEELDLDGLLARRPTVALIDELAHTNAPGSRFTKRYQDVEELLRAGINVITTLNIQHIESLYDLVERSTGVRVKERIPDYVLRMADEIVNVDLSAEDLRERLTSGKIYPSDRVPAALANFFVPANLTRLRELAMNEIAQHLDHQRQSRTGGEKINPTDRVMVCLSSQSPNPEALMRKASRLATSLTAPWYAVHIQTPQEGPDRVNATAQRLTINSLTLAHQLGGTPLTYKGNEVVSTIAAFVKEYGITQIVLGRTNRPWYARWFGLTILERLLIEVQGVDLLVIDNSQIRQRPGQIDD